MLGLLAALAGAAFTTAYHVSSVPGLANDTWAMVTAFTDFGVLAWAAAVVLLALAVALKPSALRVVAALVSVGVLVLHASWLAPRFVPDGDRPAGPGRLEILAENLYFGQADPSAVVAQAARADVLILVEITESAAAGLQDAGLEKVLPHAGGGPLPRSGPSGTRVYSRYPILESRPLNPAGGNQNWLIRIDVDGIGPVSVVGAHPTRPKLGGSRWQQDQDNLREHLPRSRTVVAGDFNAVDSHSTLRRLRGDGFRGAAGIVGAGRPATFPADRFIPALVDIDHVFVSADLTATSFRTVDIPGSDHRGVEATIALRG